MYNATADKILPTALIGSLPRPSWYTATLGPRSFLDAMVHAPYREQYTDAVAMYLHDQDVAGLDILTDGDARFDHDVGGVNQRLNVAHAHIKTGAPSHRRVEKTCATQ